jgi:hypothetical protein
VSKEDEAKARRHAIYKEGVATKAQVASGHITAESLKAKGFVKNETTGDWHRPTKGDK